MAQWSAGVSRSDESDQSLGILNMDEMKGISEVFGESSRTSTDLGRNSMISERWKLERMKAFETLNKSHKSDILKTPEPLRLETMSTPKLNHTDYVPYRRPNAINITDLITDETINLELSSGHPSFAANVQVSFEPGEITARSTHHKNDLLKLPAPRDCSRYSVSDILATSLAPKARSLRESLPRSDLSLGAKEVGRSTTTAGSSSNIFSTSGSLPRTADMSKNLSFDDSFGAAITTSGFPSLSEGDYASEEFAPAELMQSKILKDEISWAQKYAAIPYAALSEEAKAKLAEAAAAPLEFSSASNSMFMEDGNFSLGKFFYKRSEDICNIIRSKSPDKNRTPVALVDTEVTSTTIDNLEKDSRSSSEITPTADCKTYSREGTDILSLDNKSERHESKDSGNSSETSYLLSMSAIDKALNNLTDIHTDDSDLGFINKFIQEARKHKKDTINHWLEPHEEDMALKKTSTDLKKHPDNLKENKENLDPTMSDNSLSKTLSFTESLLNSSAIERINHKDSINKSRSPLSPIENPTPIITFTEESEGNLDADIDEWPSTPVIPPNRVRRLKSPKYFEKKTSPSVKSNSSNELSQHAVTSTSDKLPTTKSLCSTRLDGDKNTVLPPDFGISPNTSKSNLSLATHSPESRTPIQKNMPTVLSDRSDSPTTCDLSPLSSPRSGPSSQVSSPSAGSPRLNSTTNSDRRFLNVTGAVERAATSPLLSSAGHPSISPGCNSKISLKSNTGVAKRSVSSCSNSSEFSHRDGKSIPLKVSCLQLSWGSTKLRTSVHKSMQVKNTAQKRLIVRVEVRGPGFQLVNTSSMLTLQSQECRSIAIDFSPTVVGTAVGALSFYAPKGTITSNAPFTEIPLYAYGGHAKILAHDFLKGPVGASFLPLGAVHDLTRPIEKSFKIYNKGPLVGFASVALDRIGLNMPGLVDSIEIRPNRFLIAPGNTISVRVSFRPKREEVKNIIKRITSVLTLTTMHIITGDESTRQRLRRIIARMPSGERSKFNTLQMDMLCGKFPDEVDMAELHAFRDQPEIMVDLLGSMRARQVSLTLNKDQFDETADSSALSFPDADETILYRTVISGRSPSPQMLEPVDELLEATIIPDSERGAVSATQDGSWSVRPNILEFDFDIRRRQGSASLLINNLYKSRRYFEVTCNCKDLFTFVPSNGFVEPRGGQILIVVKSQHEKPTASLRNTVVVITVSMENERITVPVKIPKDNFY